MPTATWNIAIAELAYFVPAFFPVVFCLWTHRYYGLGGWIFFVAFVLLQIIGSSLTASAGEYGTPSQTAVIITTVGISPLMLGVSGAVHEWTKMSGMLREQSAKTKALALVVVYHFLVVGSLAIYAIGASKALGDGSNDHHGKAEWRTGIVFLFLLWLLLCAAFALLARKIGSTASKALFFPLPVSLLLLGIRLVYQLIATFNNDQGKYSMINGSTALRVIFEFLPAALVILVMVVGGVLSREEVAAAHDFPRANITPSNQDIEVGDLADSRK